MVHGIDNHVLLPLSEPLEKASEMLYSCFVFSSAYPLCPSWDVQPGCAIVSRGS